MLTDLRIIHYKKRLAGLAAAVATGLALAVMPAASALSIGGPSDCDDNAIIRCGSHSTAALQQAYNSSGYIQKVYAHFGVSGSDMSNLGNTNVAGRVTRDGQVFVNSQSRAVATNAVTGGRQNMPGSTAVNVQGAVFYQRPPSASFQQESLPAFVAMKNGRFQFAVIASCGNAVRATPTQQPKTAVSPARAVSRAQPKPQKTAPAPTQTQSQQQSQSVSVNNSNTQNVQPTAPAPQTAAATETAAAPAAPQPVAQEIPGKLVNTGPAETAGLFLASTALGTLAYRRFVLRKLLE